MLAEKNEERKRKAKQFRYKKPIVRDLNLSTIKTEIWDMLANCSDIHWYDNDEESLVNALDGDEDEAYEFKMAFSDLEADLEQFDADLDGEYISEYFDIFFPAIGTDYAGGFLGYDSYEGDYFGIAPYEYAWAEEAAAKKLMTLTKSQILEIAGQCLKIAYTYLGLRHRYDCLEAAIDTLRGKNLERIQIVKAIEEQYLKAEESSHGFQFQYGGEIQKLENLLHEVPAEYWLQ